MSQGVGLIMGVSWCPSEAWEGKRVLEVSSNIGGGLWKGNWWRRNLWSGRWLCLRNVREREGEWESGREGEGDLAKEKREK